MHLKRIADVIITGFAVVVLVGSTLVLVGPGGTLTGQIKRTRENIQTRKMIESNWSRLISEGRLSGGRNPITIVEFSDYECSYCRQMAPVIDSLIANGQLVIAYRHYPLRSHPAAADAALAAICCQQPLKI